MRKKLESLQRIAKIQKQLHDLEVWKLADATRRKEMLEETVEEVISLIGKESIIQGAVHALASRHLRRIDGELTNAKVEMKARSELAVQQGARTSVLDRRVSEVASKVRDIEERKTLSDMSERLLSRGGSSSGQAE